MNSSDKKHLLSDVDIDEVVKSSIRSTKNKTPDLNESYVAQPKQYRQVSELVSQKTKDAHTELYKKAVEKLNDVSAALDTADRSDADSRHSEFRSLKADESKNLNAVWLHELYFANCYDPNSEVYMDSSTYIELQRAWGTFEDFQKEFMACAMSCGNGWAVCGYNMYLKKFVTTYVSGDSRDVMMGLYPVLVIDVHEHAYYKDYLTDKRSYIVSQMREINWNVVEERVNRAKSIAEVMK